MFVLLHLSPFITLYNDLRKQKVILCFNSMSKREGVDIDIDGYDLILKVSMIYFVGPIFQAKVEPSNAVYSY